MTRFVSAVFVVYFLGCVTVSGVSEPVKDFHTWTPYYKNLNSYDDTSYEEFLTIELRHVAGHLLRSEFGSSEIFNGSYPLILTRGQYTVNCCVNGGSRRAVLYLEYNGIVQNVTESVEHTQDPKSNGMLRKHCIEIEKLDIAARHNDQEVFCRFSDRTLLEAGITLRVQKPEMVCNTMLGQLHLGHTITCNITAHSGLTCDQVRWVFGSENYVLKTSRRWHFEYAHMQRTYGVMTVNCISANSFLTTSLYIRELKTLHISSTFYLVYGDGDSISIQSVKIYLPSSAAVASKYFNSVQTVIAAVLSTLCCVAMLN